MHATQHVCAAVAIELWDVVAPHGLVRPGALSDTAMAVVLVSTIPLRMTCATLHRHLWPCRNNQRVAQQPHCPQRSPRLLRAFHELSEPAVHVAMLVALFERMLRCCINILIISYILHLYLQLILIAPTRQQRPHQPQRSFSLSSTMASSSCAPFSVASSAPLSSRLC